MKPASIKLKNLRFSRKFFSLSVDTQIPPGKMTVVLGPSGCGKSTLLDLIAGFLNPDSGQILDDAVDMTHMAPNKRHIGMVFQDHALFPHMNVSETIAYGLRARGFDKEYQKKRTNELLELIGLEKHAGKKPDALSGGEKQRVSLARALAARPRLLLLDEPFSALDVALRRHLRDEVLSIQRAIGTTGILVTHDQDEALSIADHLAVMYEGKILQEGPPEVLWDSPADVYTARFLGRSTTFPVMNYEPDETGQLLVRTSLGLLPFAGKPQHGPTLGFVRPENVIQGLHPQRLCSIRFPVIERHYIGGRWRLESRLEWDSRETLIDVDWSSQDAPRKGDVVEYSLMKEIVLLPTGA